MSTQCERVDLEAIRARAEAATAGPWWFDESDECWRLHGVHGRIPGWGPIPEQVINHQILKAPKRGTTYAEYWPNAADAEFIAAAREDVPALIAEVERLRAEHEPRRGSDVELWLKRERDGYQRHEDRSWDTVDMLLDDYREHADFGVPLGEVAR